MSLNFKQLFALNAAKAVIALRGGKSTSAPGLLAQRLAPDLFNKLLPAVGEAPILVTGTNGKSTTAGILASILQSNESNVIHNRSGANLASGLLTTLVKHSSSLGVVEKGQPLLEVDEAVIRKITPQNPAKLVLVNNFFRDQLDRFGEMETTISLVQEGINLAETGTLVLNADDPNVCRLNAERKLYFGISEDVWQEGSAPEIFAEELGICPSCKEDLKYKKQWLGQFGDYYCPSCGYKKPKPQVLLTKLNMNTDASVFTVKTLEQEFEIKLPLPGLFNVYNALGAIAAANVLGIPKESIQKGVANYQPLFGRSQEVSYKGQKLKIFLIKNPIGASEVLRLISSDPKAKVLVAINDNYADGRDVSWLWDAHFEYLSSCGFSVIASGKRGTDIAVRLKYAKVKQIEYIADLQQALDELVKSSNNSLETERNLYVVPTYTALLRITEILGLGKE
ncbi:MAG: MurT ligase domain-containing protein [Candidatus Caenarcaniphilales bacterium]|nr:MurT ligase domain-containing protein [Candidatus Caenarcaniphilales bacterium]